MTPDFPRHPTLHPRPPLVFLILCAFLFTSLALTRDRLHSHAVRPSPPAAAELSRSSASSAHEVNHACRFWALIGSGYSYRLLDDQLRTGTVNLKQLGGINRDGWGFAYWLRPSAGISFNHPIIRRGGPPADDPDDPDYGMAVDELVQLPIRTVLAHVRAGSSGHWGVPDPHPFEHDGMAFAHNGDIPAASLVTFLNQDDPQYLDHHPPDWVDGYIDSELYFLFLVKYMHAHPELPRVQAIRQAVHYLAVRLPSCRLNFILSSGDTLLALRCCPTDTWDPVRYSPAVTPGNLPPGVSTYWAVASQSMGSDIEGWAPLPPRTLAEFVPDRAPRFLAIDAVKDEDAERPSSPAGIESRIEATVGNAWPNPARNQVRIPLVVPVEGATVGLEIWDLQGRCIRRAPPAWFAAGPHEFVWDGRQEDETPAPNGTYFCRTRVGDSTHEQRLVLIH